MLKIYGISQNPDTNDYILVQNNFTWPSGNEKIDDFIQEMQLNNNRYNNIVLEWIPYNQFNIIEEIREGGIATVYSAIWKDGPLYNNEKYRRNKNKEVTLKCLYNSQNITNELLNKV